MIWNFRSKEGLTLVEFLVVVALILTLSAITLPNLRLGETTAVLEQTAMKLSQDLRRLEEMAMSSQEFQGIIPPGGYGLYIQNPSSTSYLLFADCGASPDRQYTASSSACNGAGEVVEQIELDGRLEIADLLPSWPLNIVFIAPRPTVIINNNGSLTEATIVLRLKSDATRTRTIKVNQAGLIETF